MARYKEDEREEALSNTRRQLLNAAADEFAHKGYSAANVNNISQAAGFAKGTVYNHFESKRALMVALIKEVAEIHLAYIAGRVRAEDAADRRLERFFEAGSEFVTSHLPQAQSMVNVLYGPDAGFKQVMYAAYLPIFDLVGLDIIALGIDQGLFRSVDSTSTAAILMNFYLGIASQVDEQGRPWIPHAQVSDFLLNGLRRT